MIAANRVLTWKWRGASRCAENAFLRVLWVIAPAYLTARASRAENLQPGKLIGATPSFFGRS